MSLDVCVCVCVSVPGKCGTLFAADVGRGLKLGGWPRCRLSQLMRIIMTIQIIITIIMILIMITLIMNYMKLTRQQY